MYTPVAILVQEAQTCYRSRWLLTECTTRDNMVMVEEVKVTEPLGVQQCRLADLCPVAGDRVKLVRPLLGDLFTNAKGAVVREVFAVAGQLGKVIEVNLMVDPSRDRASVCFDTVPACTVPLKELEVIATDRDLAAVKVELVEEAPPVTTLAAAAAEDVDGAAATVVEEARANTEVVSKQQQLWGRRRRRTRPRSALARTRRKRLRSAGDRRSTPRRARKPPIAAP